ncbi:uncharacterized protein PHACADRAFT_259685 [Phanerochaete carnosa HHB-10118-sp]|uniref:Uncharacterized protein n=1 Tax=Phanerochaete carnosa (strain HHB-10118-sp) TaxID=650164 RepID=K5W2N7_PHACS|nr:uncharacterized protein PHACADRAFT_259685 [Phanerochaete carnosa HHB-10118-sp]EKM53365.1 hypothetical protein PHACADRAFT_259685 [Phanerochaete carnosa HHB-10118-sp]
MAKCVNPSPWRAAPVIRLDAAVPPAGLSSAKTSPSHVRSALAVLLQARSYVVKRAYNELVDVLARSRN